MPPIVSTMGLAAALEPSLAHLLMTGICTMRDGYWLNYRTGTRYLLPAYRDHEMCVRDAEVARMLGVPAKVFKEFTRFKVGTDRAKFLVWVMSKVPLMRLRGHGGEYNTFEFRAANEKEPWGAIRAMAAGFPEEKLLNIHNFAAGKGVQVSVKDFGARFGAHKKGAGRGCGKPSKSGAF